MGGYTRHEQPTTLTSAQALARLRDGNARFLAGQARFPTVRKEVLASLARAQSPFAVVLGCSDSRVPPELLFDASFGELFVVRVAGNAIGPAVAGSVQYASLHLGTPLLLVLGHESCGAVAAAMESRFDGVEHASRLALLLEQIMPSLDTVDPRLEPAARLECAVEANVRATVRRLRESPELRQRVADGLDRRVEGAICELATGRVRFLD
jgi:carbonic anhydrase